MVYLDVCCFKRPFDDAAAERVRREAEAVAGIVDAARAGAFELVRSPAHDFENERNPREDRRVATRLWLNAAAPSVTTLRRPCAHASVPLSDSGLSMRCTSRSPSSQQHDGS